MIIESNEYSRQARVGHKIGNRPEFYASLMRIARDTCIHLMHA
jgi:hypothetical protein